MPATATAPAPLPFLFSLARRDLVALCDERGIRVAPRDTAAVLRERLEDNDLAARRDREYAARNAAREESEARRAHVHEAVEARFVCTSMPRRAISDALHAVEAAAGGGFASHNDSDGREARLLWSIDRLVAVLRAAAEPMSDVTIEDALLEAEAAESAAAQARRDAERARANVEARLRDVLRSLEGGR